MTKYRFTSAALFELAEATLHYEQKENGLGVTFLDEVHAALGEFSVFRRPGIHYRRALGAVALTAFPLDCFIRFVRMRF